jgi:hypothetical protein
MFRTGNDLSSLIDDRLTQFPSCRQPGNELVYHSNVSVLIERSDASDHSFRRATMGSTLAARRAGTADASSAAKASVSTASVSMTGSHGFTPKS